MNTSDIRRLWVDFFAARGHRHVPSSSLIPPPEERTLLFTNAGMNQMKPYFMAMAEPPSRRMTSIQKCFRTSDIEEVGDSSHCTFFEMLGNFSVGDYFKAEVIPWAWELLTEPAPKGMGLDKDRLWATIFQDDDESFEIWRSTGVPAERIVRYGEKENYWFMGNVGPCGPNTEINYDFGAEYGCLNDDCHPNCERPKPDGSGPCDRFLEIWNLVFMTLFQDEDGSRRPLPMRNVDTGAGLERWSPVLLWQNQVDWQGNPKRWTQPPTIYDTDLFRPILARLEELTGVDYDSATEEQRRAMRIVAEHTRSAAFLIADGVTPANDGRGYVLRRLIRRAAYFALGIRGASLVKTSIAVMDVMGSAYPTIVEQAASISRIIEVEEEQFNRTLARGRRVLLSAGEGGAPHLLHIVRLNLADAPSHRASFAARNVTLTSMLNSEYLSEEIKCELLSKHIELLGNEFWRAASDEDFSKAAKLPLTVTGRFAFTLYDSYGFPVELTKEIASENPDMILSNEFESEFEALMQEQRQRSRAATRFEGDSERIQTYAELGLAPTEFVGYETTRAFASVVSILLDGNTIVRELTPQLGEGHRLEITLDHTPFYAEGGGQVGDRGELRWPGGRFVVEDTQHVGEGGVVAHLGRLEVDAVGPQHAAVLHVGDPVEAVVDADLRGDTMRNHTGTHILHAALRKVLGSHVRQAGSLVTPDRLRFDFTHLEALSPAQVREVEVLANRVVRENLTVHVEHKSYEEALADGALAFFGDKYADVVRVVGVCDVELHDCFSHELCGGTHVHASGEVGSIIITGETSIGTGLRRIEAVTGRAAAERTRQDEEILARLGTKLQVTESEIEDKIALLNVENERLRRQIQTLERRLARNEAGSGQPGLRVIGNTNVFVRPVIDPPNVDYLRDLADSYKETVVPQGEPFVILLGATLGEGLAFLAMASPDVAERCSAVDVVRATASVAEGSGGGRPVMAQGGGKNPSKLHDALNAGREFIEKKLGA